TPRTSHPIPGASTGLTQAQTRQMLRVTIADGLITCPVESWFQTYIVALPNNRRFDDGNTSGFVESVKAHIDKKFLDKDGWKPILAAKKTNKWEEDIYQHLADIADAVGLAAHEVDLTIAVTNILNVTGHERTISEFISFIFRPNICIYPEQPFLRAFIYGEDSIAGLKGLDVTPPKGYRSLREATQVNTAASQRRTEWRLPEDAAATSVIGELKPKKKGWSPTGCMGNSFRSLTEQNYLIQFFLFLVTASPTQLGYDPTVQRREVSPLPDLGSTDKVTAYEYQVQGRRYLTQGDPISDTAAYNITSRATRVWLVREIFTNAEDGKQFLCEDESVLRDAWLFFDAELEGTIQADIFSRLAKIAGTEGRTLAEEARPYFMTIMQDWPVEFGPEQKPDVSFELPLNFSHGSSAEPEPSPSQQQTPGSQRVQPSTRDANKDTEDGQVPKKELEYHRQKHVRTVYKEVCESIYEVDDFAKLLRTLRDNVKALWYMRMAGYVHRDVSAGNCLRNTDSGHGMLSDLEFARPYDKLVGHDLRMGTPSFMAIECQEQDHLFLPLGGIQPPPEDPPEDPPTCANQSSTDPQPAKFIFNFYHDLESALWIYVWFLLHRVPKQCFNSTTCYSFLSEGAQDLLECDVMGKSQRRSFLQNIGNSSPAQELFNKLRPLYTKDTVILPYTLVRITHLLNSSYVKLGRTQPVMVLQEVKGRPQVPVYLWDNRAFLDTPYNQIMQFLEKPMNMLNVKDEKVPVEFILLKKKKRSLMAGEKAVL
ncbi:hypothetical protein DXG01_009228, partial [Tephrocybe rancida]